MVQLKFIGTGAIGARQSSASTLINDNILIDLPNGIVKRMRQMDVDVLKIKKVLITHLHGDHFLDIPFFILERFFAQDSNAVEILCPPTTADKIKQIFNLAFPGNYEEVLARANLKFVEFDQLDRQEILEGVFVTSYLVEHGDLPNANGFVIEVEGQRIGFSGDSRLCDSVEKIVQASEVSVLDMSLAATGSKAHMGVDDIEFLCGKYPGHKIVATHMQDATRRRAKAKNIANLVVPDDGEVLVV